VSGLSRGFDAETYVLLTEFASDIASHYPGKRVTLLHSRDRLLPKFDPALGSEGKFSFFPAAYCRTPEFFFLFITGISNVLSLVCFEIR
jgi:hypothetical protein